MRRRRSRDRRPRWALLPLLAILMVLATLAGTRVAFALFTNTQTVTGNAFSTATLAPPTGVTATGGASITLNWTATTSTYATGYNVLRGTASGGPYTQIAQVTPRTTTTYPDTPAVGTYYYVLQSYVQNWLSVNSNQATAGVSTNTGLLNCAANAAVTTNSGDNNGFELNPGNACAGDTLYAEDVNSGTGTGTGCTATTKDRHIFYNYGVSVPASVINGIELRLDGFADSVTGSPRFCAELSWNGGTSWTTAKVMAVNLTTTEATYTLGAANDTWGRTWTPAELSDANFRVRITDRASDITRDFRLEWAPVRVTYTPP